MNERVTVELDEKVIAAAREAGIDLSEFLNRALRRVLPQLDPAEREQIAQQWYEENKEAVDSYNEFVEKYGVFSDGGGRTF
jgi:post-segregation antitoxin (ccd killing protein)